MPLPYSDTAQSLLFVRLSGIIPKSSPDIVNHPPWYHLQVAHWLRCIPPKPPLAHLPSWESLQLLQSSSADVDGSCTASAQWPCIARGSKYFYSRYSRLVLGDTDLYLLNCKLIQPTDSLCHGARRCGRNRVTDRRRRWKTRRKRRDGGSLI